MRGQYVELHCHSMFSLLDGASSPEDLLDRATECGMDALALTDHDAVYGAVRFVKAAQAHGIHPILGSELTLSSGHHLTLLVKNETGWSNLCAMIQAARRNASKGEALLPEDVLEVHTEGLIALSGCRKGIIPQAILQGDRKTALEVARYYADLFGQDNFWIELQHHLLPEDDWLVAELVELSEAVNVGYAATNNVHYAIADRKMLQDVLMCIQHNIALDEATVLRPNAEYYLKLGHDLASLFAAYPEALTNTLYIAQQCAFQLRYGLQELPAFPTPTGIDTDGYLHHLCEQGLRRLGVTSAEAQLAYELGIIQQSGLSNYFLIVWDIVRFARKSGILCQGRGSAANSLVAYLLGISPINPIAHGLVFERFLSSERQVVPDIDIDFDAARREEVIQYVYQHYSLEHAAMACTLVTFRARSAIRDVGKAMGLPLDLLEHVTTTLDVYSPASLEDSASLRDALGGQIASQTWQQIMSLAQQIDGFPRHIGIHNGGMVITGAPLSTRVPTEPATMADRYVVQWDKDALEEIGLVKIDILGLRMLSAIAEAVHLVEQITGHRIDLSRLTFDDPGVYDMICAADTIGVFQVESRAQAQVLPRLKPRQFADLIVCISLIRPGPIQGDMVHPYLRRWLGEEPVIYYHPLLEPALKETLGVILFQEQVLKVARDLAGFTAGQGELLRRALGSKNPGAEVDRFHEAFIAGAVCKGVDSEIAEMVFEKLRAFGGYSFPKSHAASFAVLVYWSAWLKHYYPLAFAIALLDNQPMGFWSPGIIVSDAQRRGIKVLNVNVNRSEFKCTPEGDAIRLGFNYVKGFSDVTAQLITDARGRKPFTDLADFSKRTRLPRLLIEHLIQAGAFKTWKTSKRDLLWNLGTLDYRENDLGFVLPVDNVELPPLSQAEDTGMEYASTGLSTGPHVMTFYRPYLAARRILNSKELNQHPEKQYVQVAGEAKVYQQPPTAKGVLFITLEDEYGFINVVVRPKVYLQFRRTIRGKGLLLVYGRVERNGGVTNLVAARVLSLSEVVER